MSTNLKQLLDVVGKVIAYRDSKGFAATTWDTLPIKLACIFCEIEELAGALEAYSQSGANPRSVLPHSATVDAERESADVGMYALSILHDLYCGEWTMRDVYHGGTRALSSPAELTKALRRETRGAFEHWRKGNRKDVMIRLELLLGALIDLRVRVLGTRLTLAEAIEEKIAHAASRPMLHGGKDPRS